MVECMKKIKYSLLGYLLVPLLTRAESLIDPSTATGKPQTTPESVEIFIGRVQGIVFGVAGIIAVAMIIYGAVLYMTAGGNDDKIAKAKQTLTWAIGGLLVVVLSLVIINVMVTVLQAGK